MRLNVQLSCMTKPGLCLDYFHGRMLYGLSDVFLRAVLHRYPFQKQDYLCKAGNAPKTSRLHTYNSTLVIIKRMLAIGDFALTKTGRGQQEGMKGST